MRQGFANEDSRGDRRQRLRLQLEGREPNSTSLSAMPAETVLNNSGTAMAAPITAIRITSES